MTDRLCVSLCALLIVTLVGSSGALAFPPGGYEAVDLGALVNTGDPNNDGSSAWAISESGIVIGSSDVNWNNHAFMWTEAGGMVDITALGMPGTARDVNDAAQVLGQDYLWTQTGGTQSLVPAGTYYCYAHAVNNSGQAVGGYRATASDSTTAFLWTSGGGVQPIVIAGAAVSDAQAVNDLGQVAGVYYADNSGSPGVNYIRDADGTIHVLGSYVIGDGMGATVCDMNNTGMIAGYVDAAGAVQAFVWTEGNGFRTLPGQGMEQVASGVNDEGIVVGWINSDYGSYPMDYAFAWSYEDGLVNLNDLIVNAPEGYWISGATDINNSGQIIGIWYDINGDARPHAVLLNPIPEPATLGLLALGLAGLAGRRASERRFSRRRGMRQ